MGKFAESAAQHDLNQRGDGVCVAGKWISENLDEEDLVEFTRLANGHKWHLIVTLSENKLRAASLNKHVHGLCACVRETPGKACCTQCDQTRRDV